MGSGRLDVSGSVPGRYPLEQAGQAVRRLADKDEVTVRLVLVPGS